MLLYLIIPSLRKYPEVWMKLKLERVKLDKLFKVDVTRKELAQEFRYKLISFESQCI
jgi:hypothetical protein